MAEDDYNEWVEQGRGHQHDGRAVDALLCYRKALEANPEGIKAQFHLGEVMRELSRSEDAIAAWRHALTLKPEHRRSMLALASELGSLLRRDEALVVYRELLAIDPRNGSGLAGLGLTLLVLGDMSGYAEIGAAIDRDIGTFEDQTALASALASAPASAERTALLARIQLTYEAKLAPLMLALIVEDAIAAWEIDRARRLLTRAAEWAPGYAGDETLRRLAVAARGVDADQTSFWAQRYARYCTERLEPAVPVQWPRRNAGTALRVAYLIPGQRALRFARNEIAADAYVRAVVAAHARERIAAVIYLIEAGTPDPAIVAAAADIPMIVLRPPLDPALARVFADSDFDVMVDLAGMDAGTGPLLAQRPARSIWTYERLAGANVAPLVTDLLPAFDAAAAASDAAVLQAHRAAIETALLEACAARPWFGDRSERTPSELAADWRSAVNSHQSGDVDAAIAGYRAVLTAQPGYAQAHFLLGGALRDRALAAEAGAAYRAALAAAPRYVDARVEFAKLAQTYGDGDAAAAVCRDGLALAQNDVILWRSLGLAELARRDGEAARVAFEHALALAPGNVRTHYNHGVALQMLHRRDQALLSYERALALAPGMIDAMYNVGVIRYEQKDYAAANTAFRLVLKRDRYRVPAYKVLGETLREAQRLDDWLKVFRRFEKRCPDALPLAVHALEVCQYRADFPALNRTIERLRRDEFKPASQTELVDCLEQLLQLMLYFDIEPAMQLELYRAYNAAAVRVYGAAPPPLAERKPGRVRIGYVSGDLRNHVMGKMMWEALRHHDRDQFELFFYSLSAESDEWTLRYRGIADRFEVIAELSDREAAQHIAADDIDILVDLATHTKNAKPGIFALKPARVQITHVASAGALGLEAVDFKLTDRHADLPGNQAFQIEKLLPLDGCVYPYRHVVPAPRHGYDRAALGIAPDTVLIGGFVNPMKLSERCLSLWRAVLERLPNAQFAISPLSAATRNASARLFTAAGIDIARVVIVPLGRDDEENLARYSLVDFVLDPLPYGGVNGTMEPLAMGVPIVTLCGRSHGERSAYSILANLGVTETVAYSGEEYVAIAARLAGDAAFREGVVAKIRAGLAGSMLVDMPAYTRRLEQAYIAALAKKLPETFAADPAA